MNREEIIAYICEHVRSIRFGADMEDPDLYVLCRTIGSMSPEALDAIIDLDDDMTPDQIVEALEGHEIAWPIVKEFAPGDIGIGLGLDPKRN
jgi:hypothetical protein